MKFIKNILLFFVKKLGYGCDKSNQKIVEIDEKFQIQ